MEIQPLGQRNMLIYLSREEIGALSGEINTEDAADILRAALGGECTRGWENVYLEMYTGKDSLLLFARVHSGNPYFFVFEDLERLITASKLCPDDVISYLLYNEGKYHLIIYPWESETPPGVLCEYGQPVLPHPYYALHLTEHGKILLGPAAIEEIKKVFFSESKY